jgi:hypothetical protein
LNQGLLPMRRGIRADDRNDYADREVSCPSNSS